MKETTPIRVLHVVTSMNRAGLETMLMNYYRHIDRSKIQFDFLVHRPEKADYDDEIIKLGGRIYHFDPITLKSMSGYPAKMKKFLLQHPEYKIVHSHLDALSALPLAGAKSAGVTMRIAHSHNNGFSIDSKYPIRWVMKRMITRYSTKLFACSDSAAHFMFGEKAEYYVVKNAIDTKQFTYNPKTRQNMRKQLDLEDNFVIGHVGRFTHQKNHSFLIDIFAKVIERQPNAKLLLVGNGEDEQEVRRKVEQMNLSEEVLFLGSRRDISDLMQTMDVFVLPSRYEGFGIVVIEAQALGIQCFVSDVLPRQVNVAGLCSFLKLNEDAETWAVDILGTGIRGHQKEKRSKRFRDYDIRSASDTLTNFYVRGVANAKN